MEKLYSFISGDTSSLLQIKDSWLSTGYITISVLLAGSLILYWRGLRILKPALKIALFSLRTCCAFILIILIIQPVLILTNRKKEMPRISLIIDDSESMTIADSAGKDGISKAVKFTAGENGFINKRGKEFIIDLYRFSDNLTSVPIQRKVSSSFEANGTSTDITGMLKKLFERYKDKGPPDHIVLISDGTDNTIFSDNIMTLSADDIAKTLKHHMQYRDVPITTLWTGIDKSSKDLLISDVMASEFGFVKNRFTVETEIISKGFYEKTVPVSLKEGKKVIKTKKIALIKGEERYKIDFSFVPHKAGNHLYSISVPVLKEDIIPENNIKNFSVNILRDHVRVMLVIGSPSWDGKFLRRYLKGEPSVDLITFIILRTNRNIFNVPVRELSLIPFPTEELFQKEKELYKFDVIIFVDFDYRFFIPFRYLKNIKEFVTKKGGGFMMLGGPSSFRGGGYQGTPIEELLPVELGYNVTKSLPSPYIEGGQYNISLTEVGKRHPLLKIAPGQENILRWKRSFPLSGLNTTRRPKKNAVILAEHPGKSNSFGKYPVIAAMEKGNGRVVMIGTDSTWRWRFGSAGQGDNLSLYNKFYSNVIKYLTFDEEFKRINLSIKEKAMSPGETVSLEVSVKNSRYRPTWKMNLRGTVTGPGGIEKKVFFKRTKKRGVYSVTFIPKAWGTYKFDVRSWGDNSAEEAASVSFTVGRKITEKEYISFNGNLLKALSGITNGKFYDIGSVSPDSLPLPVKDRYSEVKKSVIPLWDRWPLLLLALTLFTLEWYIRKRNGLR